MYVNIAYKTMEFLDAICKLYIALKVILLMYLSVVIFSASVPVSLMIT